MKKNQNSLSIWLFILFTFVYTNVTFCQTDPTCLSENFYTLDVVTVDVEVTNSASEQTYTYRYSLSGVPPDTAVNEFQLFALPSGNLTVTSSPQDWNVSVVQEGDPAGELEYAVQWKTEALLGGIPLTFELTSPTAPGPVPYVVGGRTTDGRFCPKTNSVEIDGELVTVQGPAIANPVIHFEATLPTWTLFENDQRSALFAGESLVPELSVNVGGAAALTSSDENICTVNGGEVLMTGPGICEVTASQPGEPGEATAADVVRQWAVADPGDFDLSGELELIDIQSLVYHIRNGGDEATYDLSQDGSLDVDDINAWFALQGSLNGDTDLSGSVDFSDFLRLSQNFGNTAQWEDGDLDADGNVAFADFLILSQNFGQPARSLSVPEANLSWTWGFVCLGLLAKHQRPIQSMRQGSTDTTTGDGSRKSPPAVQTIDCCPDRSPRSHRSSCRRPSVRFHVPFASR